MRFFPIRLLLGNFSYSAFALASRFAISSSFRNSAASSLRAFFSSSLKPEVFDNSFSSIPYAEAWEKGMEQEKYIGNIMKNHDIDTLFEQNKVDELIHSIFGTEVKA